MANIVRAAGTEAGGGAATAVENLFRRHVENPFLVLALPATATAAEIERQGQKWLGMLAAGLAEARRYATPFGDGERTPELVRAALAELADPARRIGHEWWARGFAIGRIAREARP